MAYWHWPKGPIKKSSFKQVQSTAVWSPKFHVGEGLQEGNPQSVWEILEKRCRLEKGKVNEVAWQCQASQDSLPLGWGLAGVMTGNLNSQLALQGARGVWTKVSNTTKCTAYCMPTTVLLCICIQKYMISYNPCVSYNLLDRKHTYKTN